jgi:hypothetical protein
VRFIGAPPRIETRRPDLPAALIVTYRESVRATSRHAGRHSAYDEVPSVTTAAAGRSADLASRQRRYLIMMGIRLVCLPLAVVVDGWLRWVFIVGAIVLPYVAVVIANAARRPTAGTLSAPPREALAIPAPAATPEPAPMPLSPPSRQLPDDPAMKDRIER